MAIGRTNAGGGGTPTIFKVVGSPAEPENPRENTIWVQTDIPIYMVEMNNVSELMSVNINAGWTYINIESSAFGEKDVTIQSQVSNRGFLYVTPHSCQQAQDGVGGWKWMNAYIYKSGNWVQFSSEFATTIAVTYPAGSTCTCTDGATTLTAPDTSGSYTFTVPNAGTWTVHSGGRSVSLTITTNGQSTSANLNKVYLYANGDENESLTGGWTGVIAKPSDAGINRIGAYTKGTANITVSASTQTSIFVAPNKPVDLTPYTRAICVISSCSFDSNYTYVSFGTCTDLSGPEETRDAVVVAANGTVTVDISELSGDHFVGVFLASYKNTAKCVFSEVRLE